LLFPVLTTIKKTRAEKFAKKNHFILQDTKEKKQDRIAPTEIHYL